MSSPDAGARDARTTDTAVSSPVADARALQLTNTVASDDRTRSARVSSTNAEPTTLAPGSYIGRLRIVRTLGAGGMGVVYAAYDPELDREVALKLIRGEHDDAARVRLYREAQALAKLTHPNVVAIYDVGRHHDQVWISMEFVVGVTLGAWIEQERPRWRQVLSVIKQAARGLVAAHAEGLLHRDIKPDNFIGRWA